LLIGFVALVWLAILPNLASVKI